MLLLWTLEQKRKLNGVCVLLHSDKYSTALQMCQASVKTKLESIYKTLVCKLHLIKEQAVFWIEISRQWKKKSQWLVSNKSLQF